MSTVIMSVWIPIQTIVEVLTVAYTIEDNMFNVFPINSNFDYKYIKKDFCKNCIGGFGLFCSNIDLCGGHLHFVRGIMQFSAIIMRMHVFTF